MAKYRLKKEEDYLELDYDLDYDSDSEEEELEKKTWNQIFLKDFIFNEKGLICIQNLDEAENEEEIPEEEEDFAFKNVFDFSKKSSVYKNLKFLDIFMDNFSGIFGKENMEITSRSQKKIKKAINMARSKGLITFKYDPSSSDFDIDEELDDELDDKSI